jgi:hypothetical protein
VISLEHLTEANMKITWKNTYSYITGKNLQINPGKGEFTLPNYKANYTN